jgi:hypothetical protein
VPRGDNVQEAEDSGSRDEHEHQEDGIDDDEDEGGDEGANSTGSENGPGLEEQSNDLGIDTPGKRSDCVKAFP